MTIKHLFPPAFPKLDLNFAAERSLDPRITFSRSSIGTYIDATGILRYAAEDEPRFDHSGTGKSLGLLIEEARTNVLRQSVTMSDWTLGGQRSFNQTTAPDGTNTATKLYQNDAVDGSQRHQFRNKLGSAGVPQVFSVFVKAAENNYFFVSTANDLEWAIVDLTDGTVAGIDQNYADKKITVQPLANGWFRVSQFTPYRSVNGQQSWGISPSKTIASLSDLSFVGDGSSGIYVWGAQLEDNKSFLTSYIPTTGAAEDRDPDICSIQGASFSSWYNPSESTFVATYTCAYRSTQEAVAAVSDGTTSNRISFRPRNTFAQSSGVTQFNVNLDKGATPPNVQDTLGLSVDGFGAYLVNKNASDSDVTSVTMPVGLNRMEIGKVEQSNSYLNGYITRLAYYSRRLSDEQLQALTS